MKLLEHSNKTNYTSIFYIKITNSIEKIHYFIWIPNIKIHCITNLQRNCVHCIL